MISMTSVVIVVLVAMVGFLGAKWLFRKDTAAEDRRRGAAKLAANLRAYGLVKIPDMLIDYSVGDYSAMAEKIKNLAQTVMAGEDAIVKELDGAFDKVLVEKLKTESGRALIAAKLSDAVRPSDPSVVTSAPTATVK
jgi:hypothetical protein